jgi:hypothetical protein
MKAGRSLGGPLTEEINVGRDRSQHQRKATLKIEMQCELLSIV